MADAGVIEEFLVSVGFKTDLASYNVAKKAIADLDAGVNKLLASLTQVGQAFNAVAGSTALTNTVNAAGTAFAGLTTNVNASTAALAGTQAQSGKTGAAVKNTTNAVNQATQAHHSFRAVLFDIAKLGASTFGAFLNEMRKVTKEYGELYYLSQRTGTSISALKGIESGFKSINLSGQEALATISTLQNTFAKSPGREALFRQLGGPQLASINKDFGGLNQKSKEFYAYLKGVRDTLPEPVAIRQYQETLGVSAENAQRLMKNLETVAKNDELAQKRSKESGVNYDHLATISDEIEGTWSKIFDSLNRIKVQAVDPLLPPFLYILETVDAILHGLVQFNAAIPGAATVELIVALGAGLFTVASALTLVGVKLLPALTGITRLGLLGAPIKLLTSLFTGFSGAVSGSAASVGVLGRALTFALGPWGILIAVAIGALSHWKEIVEGFSKLWTDMSTGFALMGKNIKEAYDHTIGPTLRSMWDYLSKIGQASENATNLPQFKGEARTPTEMYGGAPNADSRFTGSPNFSPYGGTGGEGYTQRGIPKGYTPRNLPQENSKEPPQNARGGMLTSDGVLFAHAGEIVLPKDLSDGLRRLTQYRPDGMNNPESGRTVQKLGDWLTGTSNAPKVLIDNIEEFVRELLQGMKELEGDFGGGGEGEGAGAGAGGGAPGSAGGGPGGEGGGAGAPAGVGGTSAPAGGEGAPAGGGAGGGAGGDGKLPGQEGGALSDQAISVFKQRGWSDAAIQAAMTHGLGEGGFGENWKQSGVVDKKTGQREQSFGHWQFNMKGGEGPAYMKWAKDKNLDPKDTRSQALYVAETMEKRGGKEFTQAKDFKQAFGTFETKFERSAGGVAGKLAYAQQQGTIETARKMVAGYKPGADRAQPAGGTPAGAAPVSAGTGTGDIKDRQQGITALRAEMDALPGAKTTSGYRDPEHELSKRNPKSKHVQALAFDTHARNEKEVDAAQEKVRGMMAKRGLVEGVDYKMIDEVRNPSGHATGPHLHTELTPQGMQKYQASLSAQNQQTNTQQQVAQQQSTDKQATANQNATQQMATPIQTAQLSQSGDVRQPFQAFPEVPQFERGGLIPRMLLRGMMPAILHAGEMVLPRNLSQGLQGIISGLQGLTGGGRGGGGIGNILGMIGGAGGAFARGGPGGLLGMLGNIGGMGGFQAMRLGGDTNNNNYGRSNSMTLNQTYNNTFGGGQNQMLGAYQHTQQRLTGDLMRNFRAFMI